MSEARCGYTHDVSTLPDVGAASCWRPVWEDADRCVWHLDAEFKSRSAFESLRPEPGERLDGTVVSESTLSDVDWFQRCTLIGAEFAGVNLRNASFVGTDLREATFENCDVRDGDFTNANLEDVSITQTDLRGACLENTRLDQAVFSNTRVSRATSFGRNTIYETEMEVSDTAADARQAAEAAIWTYREIQGLMESNALPLAARNHYLREQDIRRQVAWRDGNYVTAIASEGARWVTGYGVRPWRVIGTSIAVILLAALLYPATGGIEETGDGTAFTWTYIAPEDAPGWYLPTLVFKSIYFSAITFSTLGYGDIRPVGAVARGLAGFESLVGSLLVALLVYVLSRRI